MPTFAKRPHLRYKPAVLRSSRPLRQCRIRSPALARLYPTTYNCSSAEQSRAVLHYIDKRTYFLDLDFEPVPNMEKDRRFAREAHTRRCSGEDDVTSCQGNRL